MIPWKEYFVDYRSISDHRVFLGDGKDIPAIGIGTIRFQVHGKTVELRDVLHVPDLDLMLLSIRAHRRRGRHYVHIISSRICQL